MVDYEINLNTCLLTVMGVSKGCVVLNHFLYEFNYYSRVNSIPHSSAKNFTTNVKQMI